MALEDLNPAVRVEEILDGADIEPATRLEYFMKKAANEVPKPAGSSDAGKVVTVNEDGDGFELGEPGSSLPSYTSSDMGKVLTVGEGSETVQTVIVPEQTVTFNDGFGYPTNCDPTGFVLGATAVISVNGAQYNATCADMGNTLAFSSQETAIIIVYVNNSVIVDGGSLEQATISLTASVPAVEPKWETQEPVCILKVIRPYLRSDNYIDFVVNKSVSELTACFAENSFKPAFVFLPTITSERPYFIYNDRTSCAFIDAMPTETAKPIGDNGNWRILIETPLGDPTPMIVLRYILDNYS